MPPRKPSKNITNRSTAGFATGSQRVTVEFNPDYSIVKRDLKRIGLLAAGFFALLIVLAFVLPMTPLGQ